MLSAGRPEIGSGANVAGLVVVFTVVDGANGVNGDASFFSHPAAVAAEQAAESDIEGK